MFQIKLNMVWTSVDKYMYSDSAVELLRAQEEPAT